MSARLQVMKFGGTSVGDAACMARTAQIIAQGAREGALRRGGFRDERGHEPFD